MRYTNKSISTILFGKLRVTPNMTIEESAIAEEYNAALEKCIKLGFLVEEQEQPAKVVEEEKTTKKTKKANDN